jgi:LacI family transcriptional regulator
VATIKDVARRAKVSLGTVSHVLGGRVPVSAELRERVDRAIRELDYHPNQNARNLKSRRTGTLGMVISDITNPFFPLMVRGAEDAALKSGYLLTVIDTDDQLERERSVFSVLRVRQMEGVLVVVSPQSGPAGHLKNTLEAGVPVVCLDRVPAGVSIDSVVVDNLKGALMCMRHLIAMGHRRIAFLGGSPGLQTARDRLRGWRMGLEEAGIEAGPELLREGDFRMESGYRLAKDLCLGRRTPTALFASNGMMGLGALKAFEELGLRCPEDVALAVFDDVPAADVLRPHLTVVSQPAYQIGRRGAELLIGRLSGAIASKRPVVITLEPELIVRESTVGRRTGN